jgi:hypothetical protein
MIVIVVWACTTSRRVEVLVMGEVEEAVLAVMVVVVVVDSRSCPCGRTKCYNKWGEEEKEVGLSNIDDERRLYPPMMMGTYSKLLGRSLSLHTRTREKSCPSMRVRSVPRGLLSPQRLRMTVLWSNLILLVISSAVLLGKLFSNQGTNRILKRLV